MALLDRISRALRPVQPPGDVLYRAIVSAAREPDWYLAGEVPDTVDGRFDVVALVLALVLLRLEHDAGEQAQFSADLTERFIADMDGSMRELGIGDPTVGKHVGRMVSALGGRLGAYREAFAGVADLREAVARNVYRSAPVTPAALDWTTARATALQARLAVAPTMPLVEGRLP